MKRILIGALVAVAAVSASAAAADTGTASSAALDSFTCRAGQHKMSVTAVMRPLSGTAHLQMRFGLLQLRSGTRPRLVKGRGLNVWISPADPTLGQQPADVWIVRHPVHGLAAGATYRFRVKFRWLASDGTQIGRTTLLSRRCP